MRYLLGLYEKAMPTLSWEEKFSAARASGFDYLEISIDESAERLSRLNDRAKWRDIRIAADNTGCPIKTMCLSAHRKFPLGSPNQTTREQSLAIMESALEMSSYLGIRIIQLAGYDVYYSESTEETLDLFVENLARVTEMAARYGVLLGFETMETAFMDTVDKALSHVRRINSPYLQIYPDLGNITNAALLYGHDLIADIESGRGHIVAAHLKESLPGCYREVPFGSGHVPFMPAVQAFLRQGVRMFTGEFWYAGVADWKADLRSACVFLRAHLEKAVAGVNAAAGACKE